ncbi:MAG: hypothetical protein ACT4PV_14655 [Planctomycetaceae bacterium]
MNLVKRFEDWVAEEVGSSALPALRRHLQERDYRLFSFTEHCGSWRRDVYHPQRGFFHAHGRNDADALLGILRQIWLVEALGPVAGSTTS